MEQLRIYRVEDKYIRFLHGADARVQSNKNARRPYVGIVLVVGSYRYFVPMESPKENHKNLKPGVHIMLLEGGKYGLLGFNNMIPLPTSALIEVSFADLTDAKYRNLLERQAHFINRHKADVYNHASKTYFRATTQTTDNFFKRICCDFKKLEHACGRYDPNHCSQNK